MQQVSKQVTQGTPTGLYCPELCSLSPIAWAYSIHCSVTVLVPQQDPRSTTEVVRAWHCARAWTGFAMGNSPLSLHHHLLPIIDRRGPCVLGGGFFSQERCVTLAQHPRPWGLAPFQGCTVPLHWLHLVRFFCSAASPHLGPPLSLLRISRALEILRWKAPAQQLGRKKASRHPAHLTRFQESGLEFCSFLWSLFTWVYSLSPGAGGSLLPRVGELVCVCCYTSLPTLFFF